MGDETVKAVDVKEGDRVLIKGAPTYLDAGGVIAGFTADKSLAFIRFNVGAVPVKDLRVRDELPKFCCFCGMSSFEETDRLVTNGQVAICANCIESCREFLAQQVAPAHTQEEER